MSIYLYLYLYICIPIDLSIYLYILIYSILSTYPKVPPDSNSKRNKVPYISIYLYVLSIFIYICKSINLSIHFILFHLSTLKNPLDSNSERNNVTYISIFICLSIYIYIYVYLSIYLSIHFILFCSIYLEIM